jgi:hypothetical protein
LNSSQTCVQSEEKSEKEAENAGKASASAEGLKTAYLQLLQEAATLRHKLKGRQGAAQLELERLHAKFDVKSAKATELRDYFREFKREMSRGAVFLRSGQTIPAKVRLSAFIQPRPSLIWCPMI